MTAHETLMKSMTIESRIGQLLVAGFPGGDEGLEVFRKLIEETGIGNAIFFARNVDGLTNTRQRVDAVRDIIVKNTGVQPLISIDQEGGMVSRIVKGVTQLPGPMALSAAWEGGALSLEQIEELGRIVGTELLAIGFNWNLAPDADVNVNPLNPVIGPRSFGEDPQKVAQLATAYARGLQSSGILACAKHFPGHGDTVTDSHLGLPKVNYPRERLDSVELVPFKKLIEMGVDSIMSAHILFPAVETEKLPATLSHKILTGLLRDELGFRGLVATDCLEMKAIDGRYSDAPVQAILAGADLVLVSHTATLQKRAASQILAAVKSGRISEARINESCARVLARKALLPQPGSWAHQAGKILRPESLTLAAHAARSSLTLVPGSALPTLDEGRLVYLDIKAEALTHVEEDTGANAVTVKHALESSFAPVDVRSVSVNPDRQEIDAILDFAAGANVVLGVYGLMSNPGQERLVELLASLVAQHRKKLGFVATRSAWDIPRARTLARMPEAAGLCAWEYTEANVRAIADVLCGRAAAPGKLPVSL